MKTGIVTRLKSFPALAILVILLVSSMVYGTTRAEVYAELGFESGGDTLANVSHDELSAGGGFKLALGLQKYIGGFDDVGLIFSLGYLFDQIAASNGEVESHAFVAEAIYFREFGPHRLGIGGSYHMNPRYREDVDGYAPLRIDFDNALGLVGRYGYVLEKTVELGIRYTLIDYKADGNSLDADSLGFYISSIF